ncbi:hypothetical protein Tco_0033865 [Tanacetum coccineum]
MAEITLKNGILGTSKDKSTETLTDWQPYKPNLIILEEKSRSSSSRILPEEQCKPFVSRTKQSMEGTLSKFMSKSAKRHEENSNMIKEIQASIDASVRNQGASIKTLEIQIGRISKVLQERGFGSLPSSIEANLRDHVKPISTTVEADSNPIRVIDHPL